MISASVADDPAGQPGDALLTVRGFGLPPPERLFLAFYRVAPRDPNLGPGGWQADAAWLPLPAAGTAEAMTVRLRPAVTGHLKVGMTVELRLSLDGVEPYAETRLPWPAILAPMGEAGRARAGGVATVAPPRPAPPPPPPPPADEPYLPDPANVPPPLDIVPEPPVHSTGEALDAPRRGSAAPWVVLALLLAAAAGGGAYWYFGMEQGGLPLVAETTTIVDTREEVRAYLATNPPAAEARARAERMVAEKKPDGAMLVYRHAADAGDVSSALAIGKMYDPATWTKESSPLPSANADQAAEWYRKAAEGGSVEAQRRLGQLLLKGGSSVSADAEKGAFWLRKAAENGDPEATQALKAIK